MGMGSDSSIELCPSATGLLKEGHPFKILGSPQGSLSQIIPVYGDPVMVGYLAFLNSFRSFASGGYQDGGWLGSGAALTSKA